MTAPLERQSRATGRESPRHITVGLVRECCACHVVNFFRLASTDTERAAAWVCWSCGALHELGADDLPVRADRAGAQP